MRVTGWAVALCLALSGTTILRGQSGRENSIIFTPRQSKDFDAARHEGACIIRIQVDEDVHIYIQGDLVTAESLKGKPSADLGSECNQYPPPEGFSSFKFRGIEGRGTVQLIEDPDPDNHFRIWVRIRDPKPGVQSYAFRIAWLRKTE